MKVWLDDERLAPKGWKRSKTAAQAVGRLVCDHVEEISLDHDLGDKHVPEQTGYTVLQWIEREVFEFGFLPPVIHIHTANLAAREKMLSAVRSIEVQDLKNRGLL